MAVWERVRLIIRPQKESPLKLELPGYLGDLLSPTSPLYANGARYIIGIKGTGPGL